MIPQAKCVSLETAKHLKEMGFPQDTERVWFCSNKQKPCSGRNHPESEHKYKYILCDVGSLMTSMPPERFANFVNLGKVFAAPDAQEISDLLSPGFGVEKQKDGRFAAHPAGEYEAYHVAFNNNLAEALALCWLFPREETIHEEIV